MCIHIREHHILERRAPRRLEAYVVEVCVYLTSITSITSVTMTATAIVPTTTIAAAPQPLQW